MKSLIILYASATVSSLKFKDFAGFGLAVRPVVTFTSNWGKVFTGESVTITCYLELPDENQTYLWYKDSNQLQTEGQMFTIGYTKIADTGDYQCRTPTGEISESVRLEVIYGLAVRPVVTFTPNWGKVFTGESVTITCYLELPDENQTYLWYKDSNQLQTEGQMFTIGYTKIADTGDYQCRTPTGEISESVRLEVIYGYLILQVPALVYEGDNALLRCHSWPGYSVRRTLFYQDDTEFKPSDKNTILVLKNITRDMTGKYRCVKKAEQSSVATYSDESIIHVRELFSNPEIKVTPHPALEGDEMTLTCYTSLSPLRKATELLFAFHRDGHNVQSFSPSNKYSVLYVHLEDSEKYSCAIKTLSSNIRKESPASYIQVHELFSIPLINMSPNQTTEGDCMTLTCDTSLSRHRQTSGLQFAFYMDGWEVQGFNSSNKYQIPSFQLENSGNYSCEVNTSTNSVRKRSLEIHIQVQGTKSGTKSKTYKLQNLVRLAISLLLFIVCWIMIIKCF